MASLCLQILSSFAGLFLLLCFGTFFELLTRKKTRKTKGEAPELAGAWPVLGHLPLLGSHPNIGRALAAIADKAGPVFMLRFGTKPTLVVSSWEAARECFTTNDRALADRPLTAAGRHLGYNYAMVGLAPYGKYWQHVRRIATSELLSKCRLDALTHIRAAEVDAFVKDLHRLSAEAGGGPARVEMRRWFEELTFNVVVRMVAGKRCFGVGTGAAAVAASSDEAGRFIGAMRRLMVLLATFVPSDVVPFFKWMDLGGHERAMKRTAAEMDQIVASWLQEHRERRSADRPGEPDFMDVMLSVMEEEGGKFTTHDPDTVVKATSLALIMGGTDTTSVSLTWALSLLLNHPDALKKAQEELDAHVGRRRNVGEGDIGSLPYLQAVVKEALRLYPAGPILIPHQAMEECRVAGYPVRAGTRVLVNAWAIQRDPRVWPEPAAFRPERFLTSSSGVGGRSYELLTFGAGRRACPGSSFALRVMHLALARLIHGFDMRTPAGEAVDMTEGRSATLPKATPLEVVLTPRLPSELYEQGISAIE